jgi:hypothetical protein
MPQRNIFVAIGIIVSAIEQLNYANHDSFLWNLLNNTIQELYN